MKNANKTKIRYPKNGLASEPHTARQILQRWQCASRENPMSYTRTRVSNSTRVQVVRRLFVKEATQIAKKHRIKKEQLVALKSLFADRHIQIRGFNAQRGLMQPIIMAKLFLTLKKTEEAKFEQILDEIRKRAVKFGKKLSLQHLGEFRTSDVFTNLPTFHFQIHHFFSRVKMDKSKLLSEATENLERLRTTISQISSSQIILLPDETNATAIKRKKTVIKILKSQFEDGKRTLNGYAKKYKLSVVT